MAGLSRFDFYPRDWIAGTRTLSAPARGVYIDLLAAMYDRGEAIDHDPKWLCRLLGLRDARQLQPLLDELIADRKIEIRDGKIHNRRADEEIEKAHNASAQGREAANRRWGKSGKGADRNTTENGSGNGHQRGTSEAPARHQQARTTLFPGDEIEENQPDSECSRARLPSPSPSPITPPVSPSGGRQAKREDRGKRIPSDWRPSDGDRAFAAKLGFSSPDIDAMAAEFLDYWTAAAGQSARKRDWSATWRNRCRDRAERRAQRQSGGYGGGAGSYEGEDLVKRILARKQRAQDGRLVQ